MDRLAKDHDAAKDMAEFLSQQSWVKNVVAPETNILIFGLSEDMNQEEFIGTLATKGIGISQMGPGKCRMVFHLDVTAADLFELKSVLAALWVESKSAHNAMRNILWCSGYNTNLLTERGIFSARHVF